MQVMKLNKFYLYISALFLISLQACDLSLQEDYDYKPSVPDPNINMSAWEYINTRNDLSLFVEAVRHAGMTAYYEQQEELYTYLVINNTGMNLLLSEQFRGVDVPDTDPVKLKDALLYHIIINGKFTTISDLSSDPFYVQTALKGENGLMTLSFYKNAYPTGVAKVVVNDTGSNGSSPRRASLSSNIMPTNGVIHIFDTYCYYKR